MTLNESRALLLQDEIRIALRELVALREGQFEFTLTTEPPTHFEGMDISHFIVAGGVDPQALMLELARELDTARQDSTSLLESAEEIAKHIDSENNTANVAAMHRASGYHRAPRRRRAESCSTSSVRSSNGPVVVLSQQVPPPKASSSSKPSSILKSPPSW